MNAGSRRPTSRGARRRIAAAVTVAGWLVALTAVRIGLDWSDSQPYAPWVETFYIILASGAVLIAVASTTTGVLLWRRARDRR